MDGEFLLHADAEGVRILFVLGTSPGEALFGSSPLPDMPAAREAVAWLRRAVSDDWRYRIVRGATGDPCFELASQSLRLLCRSRTFESGEAMESAIVELKRLAPEAPLSGAEPPAGARRIVPPPALMPSLPRRRSRTRQGGTQVSSTGR